MPTTQKPPRDDKPKTMRKASPKLVKMKRDDLEASVHPDEVENYKQHGYIEL